jgi:transcriptional regulator with XRE-family HTH domain
LARRAGLHALTVTRLEAGLAAPSTRSVRALAAALDVPLDELLDGVTAEQAAAQPTPEPGSRMALADRLESERGLDQDPSESAGPVRLVPRPSEAGTRSMQVVASAPTTRWVPTERPALVGWIPDGWEPHGRLQDISPALPDGYWIDPVKLESPRSKELLRSRLCAEDRALIGDRPVPGAALAERMCQHCSKLDGFVAAAGLPLVETIFRLVLAADHGGLSDGALIELLHGRGGAVPISSTLLRRLRDSVRPYPIRRVDSQLFGPRR